MKAGNLLLLSGAGLLIYGAANAFNIKNAVPNLTYSNPRIKLVKKSLVRVHLEITLDISNPGSTDIPLDYFQGKAYYNSKQIASFNFNPQSGTNVFLKGRATTPVTFTVVVSSLNVVQLFLDILKTVKNGGKLSSGITIDGSLYAAGIDLPVKFTYDFKTNQVSGIGSIGAWNEQVWFNKEVTRGINELHKWANQRLGTYSKDDEKSLIEDLSDPELSRIKRELSYLIDGSYGSEYMCLLKHWYKNLAHTDGRRKQNLRALAINTFFILCSRMYSELNQRKVVDIVKKVWSKQQMENFNNEVANDIEERALEEHWILNY